MAREKLTSVASSSTTSSSAVGGGCTTVQSVMMPSTRVLAKALTCWGAWGEFSRAVPASWASPGIFWSLSGLEDATRPGRVLGRGDLDRGWWLQAFSPEKATNSFLGV